MRLARPDVAAVADAFATAATASRLLVRGGPGSGKTHAVRTFVERAEASVLAPSLTPADTVVDLAGLRRLFRMVAERVDRWQGGSDTARVRRPDPVDLADAVEEQLYELARHEPSLVVAVDDLHLTDAASQHGIVALCAHSAAPVRWVVTTCDEPYLPAEVAASIDRCSSAFHVVTLEPLDAAAVQTLVEAVLGVDVGPGFAAHVADATAGSGGLAVEYARGLIGTRATVHAGGRVELATADPPLPAAVRTRVVTSGVIALGRDEHRLAGTLAACSPVALDRLDDVAHLAGLDPDAAARAFDRLVAAGNVARAGDTFVVAPPVLRAVLVRETGPAAEARLRRMLDAAPGSGRDAPVPPPHGEPVTHPISVMVAAGDEAVASAPASAVDLYRRALAMQERDEIVDLELQLKLARALMMAARHCEAAEVAMSVARLADGDVAACALEVAAAGLRHGNRHDDAAALLDGALRDPATCSPRLLLARGELAYWAGELRTARRHLHAARTAGLDHLDALAEALDRDAASLGRHDGDHAAGVDPADPDLQSRIVATTFAMRALRSDPARWDPASGAGVVPPDEHAAWVAWAACRRGDWDVAERAAREALAPSETHSQAPRPVAAAALAIVLAERGAFSVADARLRSVEDVRAERTTVEWARALLAVHRGEHAIAAAICEEAGARLRQTGHVRLVRLFLPLHVRAALGQRDAVTARRAEQQLRDMAANDAPLAMVEALLARALVEQDARCAAQADGIARNAGLTVEAATAVGVQGAIEHDASLLASAHAELGRLGAVVRQREVARELRRLGRRVPSRRADTDVLTATETEAACFVALGLTNRQIASQTGLSIKTVETYLSRTFSKTGCRSRTELAIHVNATNLITATPALVEPAVPIDAPSPVASPADAAGR